MLRVRVLQGAIAVLVSSTMLFGAISLGLRVPASAAVAGYPAAALVSASRPLSAFARLSQQFIDRVLGTAAGHPLAAGAVAPGIYRPQTQPFTPAPRLVTVTHPFTNRDVADAYVIPAVPFTAHTDTSGERRQPGDPSGCSGSGGSAWYQYMAARSEQLTADTFGTHYAVELGVYDSGLHQLDCQAGTTGNAASTFQAVAGRRYYFRISGQLSGGQLIFDLSGAGAFEVSSVAPNGQPAGAGAASTSVTPDGRFVAFESQDSSLDPRLAHQPPVCPHQELLATTIPSPCFNVYVRDRATRRTELVSVASDGSPGDGHSEQPAISADGRFVAFASDSFNLVRHPRPDYGLAGYYVHDRLTGTTERVDLASNGDEATNNVAFPALCCVIPAPEISADGRFVAFSSIAPNLVGAQCLPTYCIVHVFVRDRLTRTTEVLDAATPQSFLLAMTPDARYVLEISRRQTSVTQLYAPCQSDCYELYRYDRLTGAKLLVSRSSSGEPANSDVLVGALSPNGRYAAFQTPANNLVPNDTNGAQDAFWHDCLTGTTIRVSVASSGQQAEYSSQGNIVTSQLGGYRSANAVSISADGMIVDFDSDAVNLAPDVNPSVNYVYRHSLLTGATTLEDTLPAYAPVLTPDASIVSFYGSLLTGASSNVYSYAAIIKEEPR